MTGYFDESYNNRTMSIGGWIASDATWERIEREWDDRIAYENRISAKNGLPKLSRYHASDCASRQGEFKGWTVARQIRLSKRLIKILSKNDGFSSHAAVSATPMAISFGASLAEVKSLFPNEPARNLLKFCYKLCLESCLSEVAEVMRLYYTNEKITFIHDRGDFDSVALDVFNSHKTNVGSSACKQFVTIVPMGWKDCTALQAADLIAFEGYKVGDGKLHNTDCGVRRALRRIVGNEVPLTIGYINPAKFRKVYETALKATVEGKQ